jgi:dienelactone hydrolase
MSTFARASIAAPPHEATSDPTSDLAGDPTVREVQTWFGPAERPLFGWLAVPAAGRAHLGVVLCAPMAEEARATHRTFRRLAVALADRGVLAVRFDYDGTGDSVGDLTEADRVTAWLASIRAATQLLRDCGVNRVAAVGMRLGATMAAAVGAAGVDFEALVLWDPCPSGASFLREGQALLAMGDYAGPSAGPRGGQRSGQRSGQNPPAGVIDTPGFRFPAATAEQLRSLDLARLPSLAPLAKRVLVLAREDRHLPAKARQRLATEGDRLTWQVAYGQHELLGVPPEVARIPVESMSTIVAWLVESAQPAVTEPLAQLTIEARTEAVFRAVPGGVLLHERGARFGSIGLFGVATEPIDGSASKRPWLVLLNVAAEQHIGPGRQWVELARIWAGLGFRCIRLDQSGVGDSPVHPGQAEDVIFANEWLSDLPEVIDELAADGSPVALIGLCSGAYSAMEAALQTRVDAICALNPRLSTHQMSRTFPRHDDRRRAARPPIVPIARLWDRHRRFGGGLWRIYRQLAVWHAPVAVVSAVVKAGTDIAIIANPKDALDFREVAYWELFRSRAIRRTGRYLIHVAPEVDHSLLTWAGQQYVAHFITAYLATRYGAAPSMAAAGSDGRS